MYRSTRFLIFCHPDYTVGSGISPESCLSARGLAQTPHMVLLCDYRRWGLAPRPEDLFLSLWLFIITLYVSVFKIYLQSGNCGVSLNMGICHFEPIGFEMIPVKKNRRNLRLYMYHRKTESGKSPPPLRQAGRFSSFSDCHRRLRSQSSSIFPDPFFYHDHIYRKSLSPASPGL